MFNINELLEGELSNYDENTKKAIERFREDLREKLKDGIIDYMINEVLYAMEKGKDELKSVLAVLLENRSKGLNNMSTKALMDMYIMKLGQEKFVDLIQGITFKKP